MKVFVVFMGLIIGTLLSGKRELGPAKEGGS